MSLSGFVGSKETVGRILSMIDSGRLPHAVIIEGAPGSGRRTLASMMAKAAVCTGERPPCGKCPSCLCDRPPDVTVVEPEKSVVTVDAIRAVRDQAYIKPTQSDRRVFIIPDAQQMTPQAQNALLKVLEEPPEAVMFIMTCEYTRQLLGTVVSRSTVFSLTAPDRSEAVDYILSNYEQYDRRQVEEACDGGTIGDALKKLSGERGYLAVAEQLARLVMEDEISLQAAMRAYERDRDAQKGIADAMFGVMHDALSARLGGRRRFDKSDVRESLSNRLTAEQLLKLCDACRRAASDCDANMGGVLLATCFCASLSTAVQE